MLVDYLESSAETLKEKKGALQKLNRQYQKFYSKDIREEMDIVRSDINRIQSELKEELYLNLHELSLIKRYFPDLYTVLLEDPTIGKLIRKKDWLLERKEQPKAKAQETLNNIRDKRRQLREASKFLDGWPREIIDSKSISATWPALKGLIKGDKPKDEVAAMIEKEDGRLKQKGWLVLINESMVEIPLTKLSERINSLRSEEQIKALEVEKSKGKGSVKEYDALKELKDVQKKREKAERMCRHLLLASRNYLSKIRKSKGRVLEAIRILAGTIRTQNIDEKKWLKEMRERIG